MNEVKSKRSSKILREVNEFGSELYFKIWKYNKTNKGQSTNECSALNSWDRRASEIP